MVLTGYGLHKFCFVVNKAEISSHKVHALEKLLPFE